MNERQLAINQTRLEHYGFPELENGDPVYLLENQPEDTTQTKIADTETPFPLRPRYLAQNNNGYDTEQTELGPEVLEPGQAELGTLDRTYPASD